MILQPLPNAFELFGVDFLVTHADASEGAKTGSRYRVYLLEFNAEPAIEMTGSRLTWILEDLFESMALACVGPFKEREGAETQNAEAGHDDDDGEGNPAEPRRACPRPRREARPLGPH